MLKNPLRICVLFVIIVSTQLTAQNPTINIKGHVLDETTGQPVGKDIDMVIASKNTGKKVTIKVNSKTGEYMQPISSGDTYTLTFSSWAVYRKTEILDVPPAAKFREEKHEYKVKSIIQGADIANVAAFDPAQTSLSASAMAKLQEVLEIVKINRDLNVIVKVAQEQIPPPPPPAKKDLKAAKKAPKAKKGSVAPEPVPVVEQAPVQTDANLYASRVETLKKYFSEAKNSEIRIKYEPGPVQLPSPGQLNTHVIVGEVKNILED